MNGKPLVPYVRQSRAKERTISIDEQLRDIRAWASANDVPLAGEIVEQGVSGSRAWRQRALGEAVAACERGEAAGIIVAWQDRLSRENGAATAEVWEALEKAGARLVAANEGLDTATGDHEMLFTIKAAIAREQWKRYGANWKGARRNSIDAGVFPGRTPIGYRRGAGGRLVPDRRQAAKVVEAFERRRRGEPFASIGRRFGWSHSTTRQILANEVYLGVIRHGEFRNVDAHEPLVPRELFDAVQATRTTMPLPPGETTRERLLVGVARCGGCGRTLKTVRRKRADGSAVVSYFCKDAASEPCPCRAYVHADELDAHVEAWFTEAIATVPRLVDVVAADEELQDAYQARDAAEAELRAYVTAASALEASLFAHGLRARQRRLDDAQRSVASLAARQVRLPTSGTLAAVWADATPLERRTILAGFLDRVEVDRGASSNLAGNVRIVWADGTVAEQEAGARVAAA